jgi:hypothetical protein
MITAVRLANESGKNGKPSVVVLHKQKHVRKSWTYGESPYPMSDLLARSQAQFHLHVRMNCAVDPRPSLPMRHAQSARSWAARSKVRCGTFSGSKVVNVYNWKGK